jgi:hypothetical protein
LIRYQTVHLLDSLPCLLQIWDFDIGGTIKEDERRYEWPWRELVRAG